MMREPDETVQARLPTATGRRQESQVLAGRYLLHRLIGAGGAALVYEATDQTLDRRVAIKLLRDAAPDPRDRARFVSEARLLGRLSHPGLVRVLDAGIHEDRPFLVLELVRGETLADALDAGVPEERLTAIGAAVADALEHVHSLGIVHRDVKPGNVLLGDDGAVKLADFGIARLVDDTTHHTRTGTLVGTVAFLAPEQVAGEPATTGVDVYALGLVLLEGLTGRRAFEGRSVESALARLHRAPEVPTSLPTRWRSLLTAMTRRDPAERPSAREVADVLRGTGVIAAPPPGRSPWMASTRMARTTVVRLALAGAAATTAMVVALATGPALSGLSGQAAIADAHRGQASEQPKERAAAKPSAERPPPKAVTAVAESTSSGSGQQDETARHRSAESRGDGQAPGTGHTGGAGGKGGDGPAAGTAADIPAVGVRDDRGQDHVKAGHDKGGHDKGGKGKGGKAGQGKGGKGGKGKGGKAA